jgi:hypothetical protein
MGLKEFAKKVNGVGFKDMSNKIYEAHNDVYDMLEAHRHVQIVSSRQVGVTNIMSNYCVNFLVNNNSSRNVLYVAHSNSKQSTFFFKDISEKLRKYYGKQVYRDFVTKDKSSEIIVNGNSLRLYSDVNVKRDSLYGVIFDNFEFISGAESHYRDMIKLISSSPESRVIICGKTPEYLGVFKLKTIHWSEIEFFDSKWRENMIKAIGNDAFDAEFNNLSPTYGRIKTEPINKPTKDKILQVRVDTDMYTSIAVHLMDKDLTLSDYIRGLIESDLKK